MRTEKFETKLSGMICPECEDEAAAALLHTRGVISADVSYRSAAARITYDPDITGTAQICRALSEAGYPPGSRGRSGVIADICAAFAVVLLTVFIPKLTALVAVPQAEAGAGYGALFVIGLLTGVHCIGMCGGIMLMQAGVARKSRFSGPALYNLGRVISYAAVGGACGALGRIISYDAAFKSMLFTMCGALVVLIGLRMWGVPFLRRLSAQLRRPCELPQDVRRKTLGRPLLIGIATGLMPCGALSAMWLYSAASGSAAKGAASMLVFALGTVPAMLLFGALGSMIPKKYNKYILKCSTVLIVSLGLVLMIKGIRLV